MANASVDVPTTPSLRKILLKATLLSILFTLIMLLLTSFVAGWYGYKQLKIFSNTSGMSISELKSLADRVWHGSPVQSNNKQQILILGLDSLETRAGNPALTDTIMLVSLDFNTAKVSTLPLPRDLWSSEYQTKINALYVYGTERDPSNPTMFPKNVLSELTGVPIHHTLVITLDQLSEIIDLVGGIDITVTESFTDDQFPNPEVNVNESNDPKKIFVTVSFNAGEQKLDGARTLEYIRSRKSEGDEGTDLARSRRQQQVIQSLMDKLMDKSLILNPTISGSLLKFYLSNYEQQIPLHDLLVSLKTIAMLDKQPKIENKSLSIFPENPTGVIMNPKDNQSKKYNRQWVYIIKDQEQFISEIARLLDL